MSLKPLSAVVSSYIALLAVSASAHAGVVTASQDFTVAVSAPALSGTGKTSQKTSVTTSFNQFDASKGVLTGVNIGTKTAATSVQNTSVDFSYNRNTPNGTTTGAVQSTIGFDAAGASDSAASTPSKTTVNCTRTVAAPNTAAKCGSGPVLNTNNTVAAASGKAAGTMPDELSKAVDNAYLNDYVGAGMVDVTESLEVNASNSGAIGGATVTTKANATWNGATTLSYTYLEHASAGFDGIAGDTLDLDFGSYNLGDKVGSLNFSLANLLGNRVALSLIKISQTGDTANQFLTNLDMFDDLIAGGSTLFQADFSASAVGMHYASYVLTFGDYAPDAASSSLYAGSTLNLNLYGAVLAPANQNVDVPEPASIMLLGLGAAAFGLSRKRRQR
ncbi:choice-of-anchor E domain-containing protein [Massilia aerilata]|uniref:Choice-of-anchor E domain-containing protein n=1 Tax=Massilia aerilata TaxID=453817 RepID=A0ABW0S1W0_9BURK